MHLLGYMRPEPYDSTVTGTALDARYLLADCRVELESSGWGVARPWKASREGHPRGANKHILWIIVLARSAQTINQLHKDANWRQTGGLGGGTATGNVEHTRGETKQRGTARLVRPRDKRINAKNETNRGKYTQRALQYCKRRNHDRMCREFSLVRALER